MKVDHDGRISAATETIRRFGLTSLEPAAQACAALRADEPIDVAVLGQFKSGKSSLLNSLLGQAVFPVGVVPVTSVITRAVAGPTRIAHVTHLDGTVEEVPAERLAEFVTEAGNPANRRQVAVVDVVCPAMREWPGLRLVDTPGLGSMFGHNSEATRAWMPHVAVALVTISAERPFSEEDRRLVAVARQTAPRVVAILSKVDLLTEPELAEVTAFLDRGLKGSFGTVIPIVPFSSRAEPERWARRLQGDVLRSWWSAELCGRRI